MLQDNNIYDRVTRTFYNSGENLKRGQFHETYKCVMRNLPPLSFLQPQTAKDDGWPLKNNFNFIQPQGEAQCQATVTLQNFINPLYFLPLFAIFLFTHKWPRKSFQWNTLASWLAEPKRDEHTNKNCQDSRKALDKRTFFKWLCCSIKCKVISSRPLLYS